MQEGQILVAEHDGVSVIKMVGDVRLTLCVSFDQFIDDMFNKENFKAILFDLSEAEAIDSTTLGLMAKISILGQDKFGTRPTVLSTNVSINRILITMGFADIFTIVDQLEDPILNKPCENLMEENMAEELVKEKVVEAHKILMDLNQYNKETFINLVNMLENN